MHQVPAARNADATGIALTGCDGSGCGTGITWTTVALCWSTGLGIGHMPVGHSWLPISSPGSFDERHTAGIDGTDLLFRRSEALPGERLDLGARCLRDSRQEVAVCVREPGGQLVHEQLRPMSHLGSITGREATTGLAAAVREAPYTGASPVQGMAR